MSLEEIKVLREYVGALEKENKAKNAERDTLLKKIHDLKTHLASALDQSGEDKLKKQMQGYKQQLRDLNASLKDLVLQNIKLRQSQKDVEDSNTFKHTITQLKLNNEEQAEKIKNLSEELQNSRRIANEWKEQLQRREIEMMELEEQSRMNSLEVQEQIEELNCNYENIYNIVLEKDFQLTKFNNFLMELQKENNLLQGQVNEMKKESEQDELIFLSKKELIRQNNQLIESVNRLRKQSKGNSNDLHPQNSQSRIRILKEQTQNLIKHLKY